MKKLLSLLIFASYSLIAMEESKLIAFTFDSNGGKCVHSKSDKKIIVFFFDSDGEDRLFYNEDGGVYGAYSLVENPIHSKYVDGKTKMVPVSPGTTCRANYVCRGCDPNKVNWGKPEQIGQETGLMTFFVNVNDEILAQQSKGGYAAKPNANGKYLIEQQSK